MHAQTVDTRPFSPIFRTGLGTRLVEAMYRKNEIRHQFNGSREGRKEEEGGRKRRERTEGGRGGRKRRGER